MLLGNKKLQFFKKFFQNRAFLIFFYEYISRRNFIIQILNMDLEQHLTSEYGEEFWFVVTVTHNNNTYCVKKVILLDHKPQSLMEVKLQLFLQRHEIEDHVSRIEKMELNQTYSDSSIEQFYRKLLSGEI